MLIKERKKVVKNLEKYLFKLMNDSDYGKTMENLRKRINVQLGNDAMSYKRWVGRSTYFTENIL